MLTFRKQSHMPASPTETFDWHDRVGAFERLNPPWAYCEVVEQTGWIKDGDRVTLRVGLGGPIKTKWTLQHRDYIPGEQFRDEQLSGPFAAWVHTHRFESNGGTGCVLDDKIDFDLPLGPIGRALGGRSVNKKLTQLFAYRHRITRDDLLLHQRFEDQPRLTIAITGASGFVGASLTALLETGGHTVRPLVRRTPTDASEIQWDPKRGLVDPTQAEGVDAVIHLAGENLASGRWTQAKMDRIRESRVTGTRLLAESFARLENPPATFVSASAIGIYGDRGTDVLTEESSRGEGFLADVCQGWEDATEPAREAGVRVVNARVGVVMSPDGAALGKMLLPFSLGGGGTLGSGQQVMSWISRDDCISALYFCLMNRQIEGPVNLTAPNPVTNRTFTKTLGRVLRRPTILPMPAFAARLAFGKMADEALLAGAHVEPRVLQAHGYTFRDPELEPALRAMLGRVKDPSAPVSGATVSGATVSGADA